MVYNNSRCYVVVAFIVIEDTDKKKSRLSRVFKNSGKIIYFTFDEAKVQYWPFSFLFYKLFSIGCPFVLDLKVSTSQSG